ncbi:MAG: tetratricopeptide repeat protein [Burkholderiales bacterium]|nr:tetratricopeptide repeat protein [Bacteroidia bacterium]
MKKYILILMTVFFGSPILLSQNPAREFQKYRDSLQTLSSYDTVSFFQIIGKLRKLTSEMKSPQKKADVLHIIGTYYYFRTDFNRANKYYDSALVILNKFPDRKLKNLIDLKRSYILLDKGEFYKARKLYFEKELSEPNDTMAQILVNMALGQIYQAESRHDSCLNRMYKALTLSIAKKDFYYEATSRNNIGGEYQLLGKYEDARKEFVSALLIAKKINNKKLAVSINSNIAIIYLQQNKIKEALQTYQENLMFYANTDFYYEISYMYMNIASCYLKLNEPIQLKKYSKLAIKTVTDRNLFIESINIYLQVAKLYLEKKEYKEVILLSKEVFEYSKKNNVSINEPTFYSSLSKAYEEEGDNYNALLMNKKYINQKDSLDKVSSNKMVNELIFKHHLAEKEQKILLQEKENILLKKENELYNLNNTYYIVISIMILILSTLLGFYFFERKVNMQKELYASQLINDIDKDRERIAMDLHDDLGLGITIVRQKLLKNTTNDHALNNSIEDDLKILLEKTRKISRDLFPSTLKHLRFKEFIDNLFNETESQTGIICSYEIDDKIDLFDLNIKTHILRMIQECIHNSIKYSGAGAIRLEIQNVNSNKTQITYYDNGVGFKENMKEKGLGLKNIYQRGVLIKADVLIANNENNKGVKLSITLNDNT